MTSPSHMQHAAEEAILDHFRNPEHQPFHPDFLEHVILDEHRGVIGRAVMALVNKRLIVKCGRRKSTIASRKGAEANEYRLTELGRDRIAGVRTGSSSTGGVPLSHAAAGVSTASADPGEVSSVHGRQRAHDAGEPRPTNETLTLLPEPDPEAWAA